MLALNKVNKLNKQKLIFVNRASPPSFSESGMCTCRYTYVFIETYICKLYIYIYIIPKLNIYIQSHLIKQYFTLLK